MSDCQLVLTEIRQESKAKRVLGLFKPNELVTGEPFDLHLTFRNDGEQKFLGGRCKVNISPPHLIAPTSDIASLPSIKPKDSETVVLEDVIIPFSGYVSLLIFSVEDVDGNNVFAEGSRRDYLMLTNHEELYQKYAVIVAISSSALASILTIINVLVSILT